MAHGHRSALLSIALLAGLAVPAQAQPDVLRATGPVERFDGQRIVRVQVRSVRDFQTATALTDDIWTHTPSIGRPLDMRVTPEQFAALAVSGLKYSVLINDVQRSVDAEAADIRARAAGDDPVWYTNYHNYADNKAYCQALAAAYPTLCTYFVLGLTVQNREIFGLRVTGPGPTATRPASIWWSGQHAREWLTVPVTEYCAEQLLTNYATDPQVQRLVDNIEFIFVPVMNPDGYDYTWTNSRFWRKNRKFNGGGTGCNNYGVDLNRNWGHAWGGEGASTSCSNDTFRGVGPFSEPETQVMRNFIQANPRIRTTMDWHSYGQLIMSAWGYTSALPTPASVATDFQNLDNLMAAAILAQSGRIYEAGPVYTTIYPASGVSVDWAWGAQGIKGFTIEVRAGGTGFDPPATEIQPNSAENYAAFLTLSNTLISCYANCDGSTAAPTLTVGDFACFLNAFAAGSSYANCDGSTAIPTLTVADFACFLNSFASGCP